jgi:hypothetical protein
MGLCTPPSYCSTHQLSPMKPMQLVCEMLPQEVGPLIPYSIQCCDLVLTFDLAPVTSALEGILMDPPLLDSSSNGASIDEFTVGAEWDVARVVTVLDVVAQFKAAVCTTLPNQVACTPASTRWAHKHS